MPMQSFAGFYALSGAFFYSSTNAGAYTSVELKQSNMARDAYDYMIDLAEKTYNIPVRKNSGAK